MLSQFLYFLHQNTNIINPTSLWNSQSDCNINSVINGKISSMKKYIHEDNIFKLLINKFITSKYFFFKKEEEKNWKKERKMKRIIYFKIILKPFNFFFVYRLALFCGLADFCQTNQKIDRSCLAPDSASLETRGWWLMTV